MNQALQVIEGAISNVAPEFSKIVVSHGWGVIPDTQLLAAKRQVMKSDFAMKLAMNNPVAFQEAIKTAAIFGVDLTEGKRQGWLVPRDGAISFQIGYKGIEAIHQRLGVIDRLAVRTVHENDQFDWSGDDQEKPSHKADWFNESSRGEMIGAYSITYFPDGGYQVMSESVEAIYREHRDKSDSWKNERARNYSPWKNHPKAMIEKTMAQIAAKQWPAARQDQEKASQVLERLHEAETADYSVYKQGNDGLLVNELHAFMLAGDALGVYLLLKTATQEQQMDWYWWPSQPKGLKGQCKTHLENMRASGAELYECINNAIDAEETFSLAECMDAATGETRKMLAADIGPEKTELVKALLKKVEQ